MSGSSRDQLREALSRVPTSALNNCTTDAQRNTLAAIVTMGREVPENFNIATSLPSAKSQYRPNQFDGAPNFPHELSAAQWLRSNNPPKVRDLEKDVRVYIELQDGTAQGWVDWKDVPIDQRRAAGATVKRLFTAWMQQNGLTVSEGQVLAGSVTRPSATSESVRTPNNPATSSTSAGPAPRPTPPSGRYQTRNVATDNAANTAGILGADPNVSREASRDIPFTDAPYDGQCNEQLYPGCKHAGTSRPCEGDNHHLKFSHKNGHCHSDSELTSKPCEDMNCIFWVDGEFRVCEGCELQVYDHEYDETDRELLWLASKTRLPIAHQPVCDSCAQKLIREEVRLCGCTYWTGKHGQVKCARDRVKEVKDGVSNTRNVVFTDATQYCANRMVCSNRLHGAEKLFVCLTCEGFIDKGVPPPRAPAPVHSPGGPDVFDNEGRVPVFYPGYTAMMHPTQIDSIPYSMPHSTFQQIFPAPQEPTYQQFHGGPTYINNLPTPFAYHPGVTYSPRAAGLIGDTPLASNPAPAAPADQQLLPHASSQYSAPDAEGVEDPEYFAGQAQQIQRRDETNTAATQAQDQQKPMESIDVSRGEENNLQEENNDDDGYYHGPIEMSGACGVDPAAEDNRKLNSTLPTPPEHFSFTKPSIPFIPQDLVVVSVASPASSMSTLTPPPHYHDDYDPDMRDEIVVNTGHYSPKLDYSPRTSDEDSDSDVDMDEETDRSSEDDYEDDQMDMDD